MESGTLRSPTFATVTLPAPRAVVMSPPSALRSAGPPSIPDEHAAVLVVGGTLDCRRAVVAALLDAGPDVLAGPPESYSVLKYAPAGRSRALIPGSRQPRTLPAAQDTPGVARPPRRIEVELPSPLLRHFRLVIAPEGDPGEPAGARILADAARRGGAVLVVVSPTDPPSPARIRALAALAEGDVRLFVAVPRGPADQPGRDPVSVARAALAGASPTLAGAPWLGVDPAAGDVAFLRWALTEWADGEALRRAAVRPSGWKGGTVPLPAGSELAGSGCTDLLAAWADGTAHRLRHELSREVAAIRRRRGRELGTADGRAALAGALDTDLLALSLIMTAALDQAVAWIIDEVLRRLLGAPPAAGVRRRVFGALARDLVGEIGPELARVLLVTGTAGVATQAGERALGALAAYPAAPEGVVLPPIGVALSGRCYQIGRADAADADKGPDWLGRALSAVEAAVGAELDRRIGAVRQSLGALLAESIDHGILLA